MNDRLAELTGGASDSSRGPAPFEVVIDVNDTGDGGIDQAQQGFMEGFFDKVNLVKKDIEAVKKVSH